MADYGVNINLRVKGQSGLDRLKAKVNELTTSIDKIRGVDIMNPRNIGGKGGKKFRNQIKQYRQDMDDLVKAVNKSQGAFGKTANQQVAAADALENYANSITLGTDAHKEALVASNKQAKAIGRETTQIIKNTKAQTQNNKAQNQGNKFNNKSNKAAFTSGAISGAFPLLFGQGPIGGAAGFAGGFLGTKIGGQMGGFAGGLVATSILQQLTTFRDNITQLADAFSVEAFNLDKIVNSLGLLGSEEAKRLKMIEQLRGKEAALNEATMQLTKTIGEDGVASLKEFSDMTKTMGNNLRRSMTRMMSGITSSIMNSRLGKFFQQGANKKAVNAALPSDIETTDPVLKNLLKNRESLLLKQTNMSANLDAAAQKKTIIGPLGFKSGGLFPQQMPDLDALEKAAKEKKAAEQTLKVIDMQLNSINKSVEARKENLFNEEKERTILENKKLTTELILKNIKEENLFLQQSMSMGSQQAEIEQKIRDIRAQREKSGKKLLDHDEEALRNQFKLNNALNQANELYMEIGQTIKSGITDAIMGAIEGTKTLGDVARQVFAQISRSLISSGVNTIGKSLGIPGMAAGGPVAGGKSYIVGERGPELFTPKGSGMITPNNQLGGSSNVVVNVDASGSSVEGNEDRGRELGLAISAAVQSEIVNQKRPGGLLA